MPTSKDHRRQFSSEYLSFELKHGDFTTASLYTVLVFNPTNYPWYSWINKGYQILPDSVNYFPTLLFLSWHENSSNKDS